MPADESRHGSDGGIGPSIRASSLPPPPRLPPFLPYPPPPNTSSSSSSSSRLPFRIIIIGSDGFLSSSSSALAAAASSAFSSSVSAGCPSGHGTKTTYVFPAASSDATAPRAPAVDVLTIRNNAPCLSMSPPPPAINNTRPAVIAAIPPLLVSTAALTSAAACLTAALACSCASAAAHPTMSDASSSAARWFTRFNAATSRARPALLSITPRCAWNSANDRASISSTRRSSTRIRFRIIPNVNRNCDWSFVALPASKLRTTDSVGKLSHAAMITVPTGSNPRRPARPAICVYSPGSIPRNSLPSCFRKSWKHTDRAGAFTPIANVSVENRTFKSPRQNNISTISFTIGRRPAWCTPRPRLSNSRTRSTCGSLRSGGDSLERQRSQNT
mmetsp:Transcript_8517/g.31191  ORF Transcript_8517/g.31191 Transcript_8517/m.31191 type:complete len:387 (+) Transcript_8517:1060-2220(+)